MKTRLESAFSNGLIGQDLLQMNITRSTPKVHQDDRELERPWSQFYIGAESRKRLREIGLSLKDWFIANQRRHWLALERVLLVRRTLPPHISLRKLKLAVQKRFGVYPSHAVIREALNWSLSAVQKICRSLFDSQAVRAFLSVAIDLGNKYRSFASQGLKNFNARGLVQAAKMHKQLRTNIQRALNNAQATKFSQSEESAKGEKFPAPLGSCVIPQIQERSVKLTGRRLRDYFERHHSTGRWCETKEKIKNQFRWRRDTDDGKRARSTSPMSDLAPANAGAYSIYKAPSTEDWTRINSACDYDEAVKRQR